MRVRRRLKWTCNEQRTLLDFEVNKKVFERMKSSPVKVRISLAVTVFHNISTSEVVAKDGEFVVPNAGLCSIAQRYGESNSLRCRYPLRSPTMLVKITSSTATCPAPEGKTTSPGLTADYWSKSSDAAPFSPVQKENIDFWNWEGATDYTESPGAVCGNSTDLQHARGDAAHWHGVGVGWSASCRLPGGQSLEVHLRALD
jgi:hypothetical protein